jgi:hypothetical protein
MRLESAVLEERPDIFAEITAPRGTQLPLSGHRRTLSPDQQSPAPSLSLPGQPSHNGGSEEICRPSQGPESDEISRSFLMQYRFSP